MNGVTVARSAGERGSVTLVMVAVVGLGVLLATTLGLLGQALAARSRAQLAADLAAVAAAQYSVAAGADPCPLASAVADRNGATVSGCLVAANGDVALVVRVAAVMGWHASADASAGWRAW